jgi:hypothetical protein
MKTKYFNSTFLTQPIPPEGLTVRYRTILLTRMGIRIVELSWLGH